MQIKTITCSIFIILLMLTGCMNPVITVHVMRSAATDHGADSCASFWDAMKHLDLYCSHFSMTREEELFRNALDQYQHSHFMAADSVLLGLALSAKDSSVKVHSRRILFKKLTERGDWTQLREIAPMFKETSSSIFQVMHEGKQSSYILPQTKETLSVELGEYGIPMIDVLVNGEKKKFWLDTGASDVVVSLGTVKECNLDVIDSVREGVVTATNTLQAALTVIPELSIGGYRSSNIPAVILDDSYLNKKILGIFARYSVDGIIGWRLLKNIRLTFDLAHDHIVIEKPSAAESRKRNVAWLEYPLLRFATGAGDTALFFFDTGAEFSSIDPWFVHRNPGVLRSGRIVQFNGISGKKLALGESVDRIELFSSPAAIAFEDIPVISAAHPHFIRVDGIIGNDLLMMGRMIFDNPNGYFEFIPAK